MTRLLGLLWGALGPDPPPRDDRGRRVVVLGSGLWGPRAPRELRKVVAAAEAEESWRLLLVGTVWMVVLIWPLSVAGGHASQFLARIGAPAWIAGNAAVASMALVITAGASWFVHRCSRAAVAEALLGVGACPSCGHPVRDIAPAPDGCTICPECGAAWRVPGAGAPGPERP